MRQCFDIPLTFIKGVVKYAGNFDFTFDARQRWSQKGSGCDHSFDTSQKWSQIRTLHFYNTFEWCQRWEQICNELLLQTLMWKLILRKEINKLYLNTVLKIFIRQYRTRLVIMVIAVLYLFLKMFWNMYFFEVKFFLSYVEWIIFPLIDQYTM